MYLKNVKASCVIIQVLIQIQVWHFSKFLYLWYGIYDRFMSMYINIK